MNFSGLVDKYRALSCQSPILLQPMKNVITSEVQWSSGQIQGFELPITRTASANKNVTTSELQRSSGQTQGFELPITSTASANENTTTGELQWSRGQMQGFELPITHTSSASENVTNNNPQEERPPRCLARMLNHCNRVKDWRIPNKTLKSVMVHVHRR